MEIVAQRKYPPGAGVSDRGRDALQRFAAVIGRQHLAVPGVKAGFLQMEIGDQQGSLARPIDRAGFGERQFLTCERKGNHGRLLPRGGDNGKSHFMADSHKDHSEQTQQARAWFEALRTRICEAFEEIEREAASDAAFEYTP